MPNNPPDPFPTVKLNVPYLKTILDLVRDPKQERLIIIFHAESPEEGTWVLANATSRLERSHTTVFADEMQRPTEIIEQALREKVSTALVGEIRRTEDTHAMRTAAGMGLKIVAYIATKDPAQYRDMVSGLGPWTNYNIRSLTRDQK